jgi:monofunctional biosynthetic peptidoglycan transglycosylase
LEVYLNVAEMGEGIYGAQAASKFYFNKEAKDTNKIEAALLAAVLPNPRKYSVSNPSAYIIRRQNWIIRQMKYWGEDLDFDNPNTPK